VIPISVRQAYREQSHIADLLLPEVKAFLAKSNSKWFHDARKKGLDSFAQKIESGKVLNASKLEDFVAGMIVVPMRSDIAAALDFVDQFFQIQYRRPETDFMTSKKASDFPFDDIRLYGTLRPSEDLPVRPIDTIVFEIQVKTFLQHAWSIATHDLVYKFDRVSWARSRVAYQVKALLEHAELSIAAIEELEGSSILPTGGQPEGRLQELIDMVAREWGDEDLPADRRRLAMNLDRLLDELSIVSLQGLADLLSSGRAVKGGSHPGGWSPYQCIVDYASIRMPEKMQAILTGTSEGPGNFCIYVTPEILHRLKLSLEVAPRARI
jgi:ppGpp synthetase/RelA/SpoT-type nucleotidyltranferase